MNDKNATSLDRKLADIKELLSREELVLNLSKRQQGPRQEVVDVVTRRQQYSKLHSYLDRLHIADVAHVMEGLPIQQRLHLWELQYSVRGGELLLELSDAVLESLVEHASDNSLAEALSQLDADDLSYLSDFIPKKILSDQLAVRTQEERSWVNSTLHYGTDQVGSHISRDMVLAKDDETIKDILKRLRKTSKLPDHTNLIFITTRQGDYTGYLTIETLLIHPPKTPISELIQNDMIHFTPEDDIVKAALAFERYDLISAPIVNERGRLLGKLTVDVVMDVLREESTEDALNSVGLESKEDLFAPIWDSAKNRWVWLTLSLLTAFIAARVIGLFEETIVQIVALAALMPIVAAIGGNTGNQTTTLVVRALALDQINKGNLRQLIKKELGLSLLNGFFWGGIVGVFAYLVYGDLGLAQVITLAMMLTLLLAAIFGLSIPLSLYYLKRDPALGSSVLVTALTDSIGFFIFLGLATMFLL